MNEKNFVVLLCCAFLQFHLITGQIGGISSKLDFGSTEKPEETENKKVFQAVVSVRQSSPSKHIISTKSDQNPFNFRSISTAVASAAEQPADSLKNDFKDLSLICVDGGCNTTEIKKHKDGELNTDILVQISTNTKDNASEQPLKGNEENSDVPIVVGTSGNGNYNNRRIDNDGNLLITPTTKPTFVPYNVNHNIPSKPYSDSHQIPVPHFEPNFNNHYFGETPPPMYVWYKRRNNALNPQAFNPNSRPQWKTNVPYSDWQRSFNTDNLYSNQQNTPKGWSPSTICTCTNPGMNWYPSGSVDDRRG